jgi:hypothetical protein
MPKDLLQSLPARKIFWLDKCTAACNKWACHPRLHAQGPAAKFAGQEHFLVRQVHGVLATSGLAAHVCMPQDLLQSLPARKIFWLDKCTAACNKWACCPRLHATGPAAKFG